MIFSEPSPGLARIVGHDNAFTEDNAAETCWHCGGSRACHCAGCVEVVSVNGRTELRPGICGACKGAGKLCFIDNESQEHTKLSEQRENLKSKQRRRM